MTKNYLFLLLGLLLAACSSDDKDEHDQCCNACFGNSIQAW